MRAYRCAAAFKCFWGESEHEGHVFYIWRDSGHAYVRNNYYLFLAYFEPLESLDNPWYVF